jgi:hypothetical protein
MINELLSFIIIYKVYSTIIKLNFYKLNQTYSNNESINFELLHKSNILTNITIGTPPKTIKAYIQFKYFEYYIIDNKTNPDFYSKDSSSTFIPKPKEPIEFIDSPFLYGYYTTETFIFNNILNQEEKIENLPTIIGIDLNIKFPSYLGFNFYLDTEEYHHKSLIQELRRTKKISEIFSFEFLNKNEGEIIIGGLPHFYSKKYNEKDLKWNQIKLEYPDMSWNIFFNKILFDNEKFNGSTVCYLEYELDLIYAPNEYKNKFLEFNSKNDNKCKEIIEQYKYSFFVCDKSINFKNFPKIIFYSNELGYSFELNYEDLFKEINGKLYLLIEFNYNLKNFDKWRLGVPFLKKYKFIFDYSNKKIGFYSNKNSNNRFLLILIIIVFLVIIICLLLIIYNIKIIKRRKRKNEIEEYYDYLPETKILN